MNYSLLFFTLPLVRILLANDSYTLRREFISSQSWEGCVSPREEWKLGPGLSFQLPSLPGFMLSHYRWPSLRGWVDGCPKCIPPSSQLSVQENNRELTPIQLRSRAHALVQSLCAKRYGIVIGQAGSGLTWNRVGSLGHCDWQLFQDTWSRHSPNGKGYCYPFTRTRQQTEINVSAVHCTLQTWLKQLLLHPTECRQC